MALALAVRPEAAGDGVGCVASGEALADGERFLISEAELEAAVARLRQEEEEKRTPEQAGDQP